MTAFQDRRDCTAWGRAHRFAHRLARPRFADEVPGLLAAGGGPALACGLRRSYGDSCLNRDGALIDMRGLDRFIAFDRDLGVLEAEAGVTLADILRLLQPAGSAASTGWFLPVTPGTKFVTLGGAIANDVHGKNHHGAGCFGNHVRSLVLLRSDGRRLTCSATENPELFRATLGGLGLTGIILSAELALKPVPGPWLESEDIRYGSLDDFHALSAESEGAWEYTVAWIDCLAAGPSLGRGVFSRARHAEHREDTPPRPAFEPRRSFPIDLPGFALNPLTLRAFNALYWRRVPDGAPQRRTVHFEPVFYPLDAIGRWNRLYGRRGFYQYQCVVPKPVAREAVRALLEAIAAAGRGSFLAVLKTLGGVASPGLMSFPMPGVTLALDFPNAGAPTHALLDRLDRITAEAGGRIYPAKDGRVSAGHFQRGFPQWCHFARHVDPGLSSSFWRRVSVPVETLS